MPTKPVSAPPWGEPLSSCLLYPFFLCCITQWKGWEAHFVVVGTGTLPFSYIYWWITVNNLERSEERHSVSLFNSIWYNKVLLISSWFPLPETQNAAPKNGWFTAVCPAHCKVPSTRLKLSEWDSLLNSSKPSSETQRRGGPQPSDSVCPEQSKILQRSQCFYK